MEKFKRLFGISLVSMLIVIVIIAVGCSKKEEAKPTGDNSSVQSESNNNESGETEEKILAIGEKGSNKSFKEISVSKITITKSLASKEATALLQKGEAGESPENANSPSNGNEYLILTLKLKNTDSKPHVVAPVDIKLENKDAKEFTEVVTNGYGGVFNMKAIEAGKEGSVSLVYEVPKDEKELVLAYEPFGDNVLKFKIR